jgi:hypothetical protein
MGHKRSKAQKLQLLAINQSKAMSQSGTNVEVGLPSVEGDSDSRPARSLPAVRKQLEVTGKALLAVQSDLEDCRTALDHTQAELEATDTALKASESKSGDLYHALKIQKQKVRRTQASKAKLQSIVDLLQSVQLPNAREEAAKAIQLLDNTTKRMLHSGMNFAISWNPLLLRFLVSRNNLLSLRRRCISCRSTIIDDKAQRVLSVQI